MTDLDSDHAEARQKCALYLSGALDPAEEAAFEAHLIGCPACLDECDRLAPVAVGLAYLGEEDTAGHPAEGWSTPSASTQPPAQQRPTAAVPSERQPATTGDVLAVGQEQTPQAVPPEQTTRTVPPEQTTRTVPPEPPTTTPGAAPPSAPEPSTSAPTDEKVTRTHPRAPGGARSGPTRPPAGPRDGRPAGRRLTGRVRLAVGALAAVVVVAGGLFVGLPLLNGEPAVVHPLNVSVTAEGVGGGSTRLTVAIAGNDRRATIVASVVGLEAGIRYRLLGVTGDGQTHVVVEWDGRPGVQEVTGELAVSVDDLDFFTVTRLDGSVVVRARIDRSAPAPTPGG